MRLHIARDQAKGFLGGVKFELRAKVELTNDESELVRKYKVEKEVLLKKQVRLLFTDRVVDIHLTIATLVAGESFKCGDIGEILEYEQNIKESCKVFKEYIEMMRSFGGVEIVEFN